MIHRGKVRGFVFSAISQQKLREGLVECSSEKRKAYKTKNLDVQNQALEKNTKSGTPIRDLQNLHCVWRTRIMQDTGLGWNLDVVLSGTVRWKQSSKVVSGHVQGPVDTV